MTWSCLFLYLTWILDIGKKIQSGEIFEICLLLVQYLTEPSCCIKAKSLYSKILHCVNSKRSNKGREQQICMSLHLFKTFCSIVKDV